MSPSNNAPTDILLREPSDSSESNPRVKPAPSTKRITTPFVYIPSDDGTDENLLIILHGLGDTHVPFSRMGGNLKLPQTAVLALRAPEQIPYLYEEAYQWYESFDQLGEPLSSPNPTTALDFLTKIVQYLVEECKWSPARIHLFGFGQGGTVAVEAGLKWWRFHTGSDASAFASIVTIAGPLLSYPTLSTKSPTFVLVVHRPGSEDFALTAEQLSDLKKGYQVVREERLSRAGGMSASKMEWEPIMRFWSERLSRRQVEGLYEVMSGIAPAK
ncbi:hypothetical protein AX16_003829 [Volvariella volvacea WC 439]|nr:hypothetical protein AX16_003829 [Volvariella volvacea WC 439]